MDNREISQIFVKFSVNLSENGVLILELIDKKQHTTENGLYIMKISIRIKYLDLPII